MAEFCARYGFLPDGGFPWPMFLALSRRLEMFDARELLDAVTGTMAGAATGPFGTKEAGREVTRFLRELEDVAHPERKGKPARRRRGTPLDRD